MPIRSEWRFAGATCKRGKLFKVNLPRHAELWLVPYLADRCLRMMTPSPAPARVWLAITDHYEPLRGNGSLTLGRERVKAWRERWPEIARCAPRDASGRAPQYSFFYAEEEYQPELLDPLAQMVHDGIADVEIHLHHDHESRDTFIRRMTSFCETLHLRHGLLREKDGRLTLGFIHGNWALDNSLPGGKWCGVNDEITVLRDLGCYADFTMPSGNSLSQARTVNRVYWCTGGRGLTKSYDTWRPGPGRQGTRWRSVDDSRSPRLTISRPHCAADGNRRNCGP